MDNYASNNARRGELGLCSVLNTNYSPPPPAIQKDIVDWREVSIPTNYKLPALCSRNINLSFSIPRSEQFFLPSRTYLKVKLSVRKAEYVFHGFTPASPILSFLA